MLTEGLFPTISKYYDVFFALIVAIAIAVYLFRARRGQKSSNNDVPGKLGFPFLGETFSFLSATNSTKGCYDFVRTRRLWHGKWFKTRIFGKIHVFVPSVEGAKTILANDFKLFNKGYIKSMGDAVGKKSLLCVPSDSHKRIRRLLSDPFSMNSLSKFVQNIDRILYHRLKEKQRSAKSFRTLDFSMKITFDAMCNMLLSITDASLLQKIERDCSTVSDAMLSFPVMVPGTRYYEGVKARRRLMETFKTIIASRRSGNESHEDFLQSMLERDSYPDSEKLDDEEIMDNLLTLIIAGHSTTATAIMWSVKFLDENREAQDRLREEQLSILRSKPKGALLTLEDTNSMSYAQKVVKETLRMSNVLLWFPRVALDSCKIGGFDIKKGWHVNIDATYIHYDPATYEKPTQFNPSRFDEMPRPYSYIPFGSGPRLCLGINMAKITMLVFLHRLTSGYKWSVDDQDPSLERKAHIPRLRSGCPITLTALNQDEHTAPQNGS